MQRDQNELKCGALRPMTACKELKACRQGAGRFGVWGQVFTSYVVEGNVQVPEVVYLRPIWQATYPSQVIA